MFIAIACFGVSAAAQTPQAGSLAPVDRRVEDLDPLSTSLRRVEPGLWQEGQGSRVYRTADGKLVYLSGGIRAQYDRSRYVKDRQGKILQGIPENTVFHIGRPTAAEGRLLRQTHSNPVDPGKTALTVERRIRRSVDGSGDGAVNGRWQPEKPVLDRAATDRPSAKGSMDETLRDPDQPDPPDRPTPHAYRQQRSRLVKGLFRSLDRLTDVKTDPAQKNQKPGHQEATSSEPPADKTAPKKQDAERL